MTEPDANLAIVYESLMELSRLAAHVANSDLRAVSRAGEMLATSLRNGGKVLACGNGGSAADAQHFVAEFIGRMCQERSPLPAIALSVDPSVMTALSNDYGYESVFARQVEGLGNESDILLAISTSGRSRNVLNAIEMAQHKGMHVIALLGDKANPFLVDCDVCIQIPSKNAQRVQELHTAVLHSICEFTERLLFSDRPTLVETLSIIEKGG